MVGGVGKVGHIDADVTAIHLQRLESPKPIPVDIDCSVAAIKRQIPGGKLLVAQKRAIVATIEDKIAHEATRAVVHEDALLPICGALGTHMEDDVL